MLKYNKLAVIDHDWSLYRVNGWLSDVKFEDCYAIIHDDDLISADFWESLERVSQCVINKRLGERLKAYYD